MSYLDKSIEEISLALKSKKVTALELTTEALDKAHKDQDNYNAFVTILDDYAKKVASNLSTPDNPLYGIPCALKDNLSTKDILTTASSDTLNDYVPKFDATVVEKLKDKGAVFIGKTVLDELGMGGSGTTGHTGIVRNPWNKNRMIGGSSSGSVVSVATGMVPYALGSDTGDSIRKPSGYGGIVGFKPTWGRISRFGLFAFSSSLDHVGVMTRSVKDAAYVTDAIKGGDPKDMTSLEDDEIRYSENIDGNVRGMKLFYIKEIAELESYSKIDNSLKAVIDNFNKVIDKCVELGMDVEGVSVPKELLESIFPSYITISSAEATSNYSNLTGIIFGPRGEGNTIEEMMTDARSKGFSELIKRRFVLGSYVLQKENQEKLFLNAQRIRRLVVDKINDYFKEYDAMILPNSGGVAPKFEEDMDRLSDQYLLLENHLVIGNFGGFPSLTIPTGFIENMPVAINITGPIRKDLRILNIGYAIEQKLGFEGQIAKEVK